MCLACVSIVFSTPPGMVPIVVAIVVGGILIALVLVMVMVTNFRGTCNVSVVQFSCINTYYQFLRCISTMPCTHAKVIQFSSIFQV